MKRILSIVSLFIGIASLAQSNCKTDIVVTVKDAALQNPIVGAEISLVDSNNTMSNDFISDANGVVTITADCDATYSVRVYKSGFEPLELPITTKKGEVAQVAASLVPMAPVTASAGYIEQFIVQVYNPSSAPVNIRFGPTEKTLDTYSIGAEDMWESQPYQNVSDLLLWISTGKVTKKYMTKPGKAYQIEFNRKQKCYVIKEVERHK